MDTAKIGTRSLWCVVILAALVAVTLVGISVLAGWHFHVRVLVQIIPGTIAMQYNTALCFIVLGTCGLALITRQGHRFLLVAGGGFVAVMGILNILQYATGISLGIDTLLFEPWDFTLLVHPGRMALTTALAFTASGLALAALTVRRNALTLFAIANTLPLSLGLTSVFSYFIGFTSLSPFQLGIQMAIHTALGFIGYGSAMLAYAWRYAPRTQEGLPKWSPALVMLLMPIFFINFGTTIQGDSGLIKVVQLLLAILTVCLLGLTIHKLAKLKIAHKGLILISVPLIFVFGFLLLIIEVKRSNEQAQEGYLHSKDVIAQSHELLANLVDAQSGIRGYVITSDPSFAEPYFRASQEIPEQARLLQELVRDNPQQRARADALGVKAFERMSILASIEQLMRAGATNQAVEQIKGGSGKRIMDEFRLGMAEFLKQEEQLNVTRQQALSESWQRFNWLLVAGGSANILLALMLAFLFSRGINSRLLMLAQNAQALANGKQLALPMTGGDEIARLDHVFHDMAKALDDAAKKERAIVENAPDVVCSIDAEGKFVKVNPACLKLWGYTPEELIGQRYIELVAPEDVSKTNQVAEEIMAGTPVVNFENRYQHKDGSLVWVTWSASWSESEKLIFAVARDITERKRAEAALRESEERYRTLFNTALYPTWVYDLDTISFLAVNDAAVEHYGYSREEFLNMTIKDIRPHEETPALIDKLSKLTPKTEKRVWRHQQKDGTIIDVEVNSHELLFAGRKARLVVVNDITERKQAEERVKRLNENLERHAAQLEAANKELESFSYSVSHDLRAPLRHIDGFAQLLQRNGFAALDEKSQRYVKTISESAKQMGRLIDDLLAFSRMGRAEMRSILVNLEQLVNEVRHDLQSETGERSIVWKIDNLPEVYGDPSMVRLVLMNLLSNAVKYTRGRAEAHIEIGSTNGRKDQSVIFVRDNGAGFDMKYVDKLFGVFQRLHHPDEFEGTGIGLANVRRIINRHGGETWAEGSVDGGATFYFTLPSANGTKSEG